MREINLSADELVSALLNLENEQNLCLLDSCGVSHLDSHLLIAGINPLEILEINETSPEKTLSILDKKLFQKDLAAMLTISYDFGLKLNNIEPRQKELPAFDEPDVFLALFDILIIHDYNKNKSFLMGNRAKFELTKKLLFESLNSVNSKNPINSENSKIRSNFTREDYLLAIEKVQEFIRRGDTYQTNLTQQIRAELPENLKAEEIFLHLRKNHPAPFASFFRRKNDVVISASPERFFQVKSQKSKIKSQKKDEFNCELSAINCSLISVSPIKGTRPRGKTAEEDENLRNELLNSEKDRAENVMIVDLLRNDIGRICEYGSVKVEKLCDIEEHPTLFHLVSTVSGKLRQNINFSNILRAAFPCGSITGAPKIRTMQIIDQLETTPRGLSMGAIGYSIQNSTENDKCLMDFSVAIRTVVIRGREAVFNVGGGITIDSIPEEEYAETLVKAQALLSALNADFPR